MITEYTRFLEGINIKDGMAWEELYRYYYGALCGYSFKIIGDRDVAEDVVQDCLIKLWDSSFIFTDMKAITTYLYKTVFNSSLNILRNKKSSDSIHSRWSAELMQHEEDYIYKALEEELISRFYVVLYELPEQQREILLSALRGEKIKDIASHLSISENSVKTQKKRAYLYLRDHLYGMSEIILMLLFSKK